MMLHILSSVYPVHGYYAHEVHIWNGVGYILHYEMVQHFPTIFVINV